MSKVRKELEEKIASLREKNQQRAENTANAENSSNVVPLPTMPTWADIVRGVPNTVLRSALFGIVAKGRRRFMKGETIAALEGIKITYTGESLDQGDLDVWLTLVHISREQPLGNTCRVNSYQLLKSTGKTISGKSRAILQQRIERLRANAVTIKMGRYTFIGGLLNSAFKDENTQEWVIDLNPQLSHLFEKNQFTLVDWELRQALSGHPLAQWLHGFYASHAQPHPMKVETLLRLSGSEDSHSGSAQKTLRKALEVLEEICRAHGQTFSHRIEGDLVHVDKQGSASQQRHLAKQIRLKTAPKPGR